ncbi:peptidase S8 family protein [Gordonia sputi NBRC 100414]|uniref:Peptidase S8 family protein n=2 Tax=Gordonia sputi TaxID=36823 RepID=H5U553_9ACTN|nr:peptidase S8 family protein [Gordonia sputi NBRC 100414]
MSRARACSVVAAMVSCIAVLVCSSEAPALAVTPPVIDTAALIRSAPVAPPEPTEQRTLCAAPLAAEAYSSATGAQAMMRLPDAWRFSRGAGQRVAVIDTGVSPSRRLPRLTAGGDYVSTGDGLSDCDAHGTLVAGIIAGAPSSTDAFAGVAPDASIISIRQSSTAFGAKRSRDSDDPHVGSGYGSVRTLAHAVVRAVDLGATVINISEVACAAVGAKLNDRSLGAAVRYAHERDVVVVVAAGNLTRDSACTSQNPIPTGDDPTGWRSVSMIASPAWFSPYVLTVGSVDAGSGTPSDFSINGPWVSVAAPGTDVISIDGSGRVVYAQQDQSGPIPLRGTSFSTAYVSGLVALVRARYPRLTAAAVIDRVTRTAHAPGTGRDTRIGFGVVDPVAALTAELDDTPRADAVAHPIAAPPSPQAPDHTARNVALLGTGAAAVLIVVVLALALPHRRTRTLSPDEY